MHSILERSFKIKEYILISMSIIGFGIIVEFCMNYPSYNKANWEQQHHTCGLITPNELFPAIKRISMCIYGIDCK